MPLLVTPAEPLLTTCRLPVASLYVIVDQLSYTRKLRRFDYTVAYYASEEASQPGAGAAQVQVNLPTGFSLNLTPAQAGQVGDPTDLMDAYTAATLQSLLPGAAIEIVS